VGSSQIKY